jgi:hypothetical protein
MNNAIQPGRHRFLGTALAVGVTLISALSEMRAAPKIMVEQSVYDFGAITNRSEMLHDFVVCNAGDSELDVSQVISSCNICLKAELEEKIIPPGGHSLLHTRLELRLFDGPVERSVRIASNDPKTPWLTLSLTGMVLPRYQMTPAEVDLDLSEGRQTATAEITPLLQLGAPLSQVLCDNSNVLAKITPTGHGRFMLTVEALASLPRGNAASQLILRGTDTNDPPFQATVIIHNPPDLELLPDGLRFLPRAEQQMRILWVKQHGATPLILLDIIPPSANFKCEIEPDSGGYNYRVYVDAWQLESVAGQTNALRLKMRDQNQIERSVLVPIVVAPADLIKDK